MINFDDYANGIAFNEHKTEHNKNWPYIGYITGEDILPSNQQQIIGQARFTYSPLGKAFKKQIKTIEDQGEKQIKAIRDQGQLKTIKKYAYDAEDTPFIAKQKEIFNELVDERRKKITDLDNKLIVAI